MSAYEMMLSESQERMLMVLRPEKEKEAEAIFRKWGLDFAVIGETTDTLRFVIRHEGEVKADLPIKDMGDEAPEYDRPWLEPKRQPVLKAEDVPAPKDVGAALLKIMGSPDMSSRRWVWEQYDHLIQSNTAQIPGGDAAVIRIGMNKAVAMSTDVTPRYVEADPFEGAKQAVAECWRNLTAVGAEPLAVTDNLNFGNPERPEIMGQLVAAIKGIGEACRALDFPVVSGNVSLYNETNGQAILPTPAIGGVGLLRDLGKMATLAFKAAGEAILLVGAKGSHLGQSIFLREVLGREDGAPPPVDLETERRNGDVVRSLIHRGQASAVHDISDGGMLAAVAEMALAAGLGARLVPASHAELFGEDQARYVIACAASEAAKIITQGHANGVDVIRIGTVTDEAKLIVEGSASISLDDLRAAHEGWFPAFMARQA
jgi:phosphoribosylformylglycinamidine synthase II